MEGLSEYVWSVLNRDIGCEEVVYTRRKCNYYFDKLTNIRQRNQKWHMLSSGSRAEGLCMEGSDYDQMLVLTNTTVLPVELTQQQTLTCDIIMETHDVKPGFARLRLSHSNNILRNYPELTDTLTPWNDNVYMSSLFFRDIFIQEGQYGHGPCSTMVVDRRDNLECDFARCLPCFSWPNVASEWVIRNRPNSWPSDELVNEIVNDGILLVPIGNQLSGTSHMEWRISFSIAEKKLLHSMNHRQFLCYGLLKLFLKHVVNKNEVTKDLLCSYFMKTILFYVIESELFIWNRTNLLSCFWACFNRLYFCVRESFCPNYFVKENNMFEHKIYGEHQRNLLQYMSVLYEDQCCTLLRIPVLNDLSQKVSAGLHLSVAAVGAQLSGGEKEFDCFCECISSSISMKHYDSIHTAVLSLRSLSSETVTCQFDTDVLCMVKIGVNLQIPQLLYHKLINERVITSNKSNYNYLSKIRKYILHNCTSGDVCTGRLQFATLCYLTGQYSTVVRVVGYVLSQFQPYTIYSCPWDTFCANKELFIQTMYNRGLSAIQKLREAVAFHQKLSINCMCYPPEIHNVLLNHSLFGYVDIHPLVYCQVLLFLSYNALGCTELRNQTLHNFTIAMQDEMLERELPMCWDLAETFCSIAGY